MHTGLLSPSASPSERSFPGADEPLHHQLEQFLKSTGRWGEVSGLNSSELAKVLDDERWPPELLEELRKFATTEPSATVRVAQTSDTER